MDNGSRKIVSEPDWRMQKPDSIYQGTIGGYNFQRVYAQDGRRTARIKDGKGMTTT